MDLLFQFFKHFKNGGVHKATIYRWLEKIEKDGNCGRKPGSGRPGLSKVTKDKIKRMVNNKVLSDFLLSPSILNDPECHLTSFFAPPHFHDFFLQNKKFQKIGTFAFFTIS